MLLGFLYKITYPVLGDPSSHWWAVRLENWRGAPAIIGLLGSMPVSGSDPSLASGGRRCVVRAPDVMSWRLEFRMGSVLQLKKETALDGLDFERLILRGKGPHRFFSLQHRKELVLGCGKCPRSSHPNVPFILQRGLTHHRKP